MYQLQTNATAFLLLSVDKCTRPRNLRPKRRSLKCNKRDVRNLRGNGEHTYIPNVTSNVLRIVSEMAKQEEMDSVVSILKNKISCGRNVLLHCKFVKVKTWCTLVEVLSQTSTRVHQILTSTHNHEVTP